MQFYFYIILFVGLSCVLFLIRYFSSREKNIPVQLYFDALKDENSGNFEAAKITYENTLIRGKKIKYNNTLKNKIVEKLKLLHTVIAYNTNPLSPAKTRGSSKLKI